MESGRWGEVGAGGGGGEFHLKSSWRISIYFHLDWPQNECFFMTTM